MGTGGVLHPPRPARDDGKPQEAERRVSTGLQQAVTGEQVLTRARQPWEQKQVLGEPGSPIAISSLSLAQKGNPKGGL